MTTAEMAKIEDIVKSLRFERVAYPYCQLDEIPKTTYVYTSRLLPGCCLTFTKLCYEGFITDMEKREMVKLAYERCTQ